MALRRWLLICMLLLPLLAACGEEAAEPTAVPAAPESAATEAPADSGAPVAEGELNWNALAIEDGATLTLVSAGAPEEQQVVSESVERFNQQFPDVTVNFEAVPADYDVKIQADAAGSTLGDVIFVNPGLMNSLAPNGILLPLDQYMQQAGMQPDDFAGPLIELFQHDNQTFGLPKDFGALALFVNTELAAEAGVELPENGDWTWEEFRAAAEKLTSGSGNAKVYGACTPPDIDRMGALVFANQGSIISEDQTQATFNQPAAVEAIEFWHGLYEAGNGAVPGEIGQDWCGAAFGNELTAMVFEGGWMLNFMKRSFPEVDYAVLPLPKAPTGERATLLFTNAWAVAAQTQYPNAAAALAMFLVSPQNQQPIAESGFALPSWAELANLPYYDEHPEEGVIADAADYGFLAVYGPRNDDFRRPLGEALERIWLGQADVQEALDQAAQESTSVLQQ